MKQDKQLLLKDLCARLPYEVFIHYHWSHEGAIIDEDRDLEISDVEELKYNIENPQDDWCEVSWKPYLRPMSSMTEEEKEEYYKTFDWDYFIQGTPFDWLYEHHFDYRGLIEKGLALEASEDIYKTE